MAKYASFSDCVNPSFTVTELNLLEADTYVDLQLGKIGVSASEAATIVLPNAALTAIAAAWAKHLAALDGAMGEDSLLISIADRFQAVAKNLGNQLTKDAVGLTTANSSRFGSFGIGRS